MNSGPAGKGSGPARAGPEDLLLRTEVGHQLGDERDLVAVASVLLEPEGEEHDLVAAAAEAERVGLAGIVGEDRLRSRGVGRYLVHERRAKNWRSVDVADAVGQA